MLALLGLTCCAMSFIWLTTLCCTFYLTMRTGRVKNASSAARRLIKRVRKSADGSACGRLWATATESLRPHRHRSATPLVRLESITGFAVGDAGQFDWGPVGKRRDEREVAAHRLHRPAQR